MKHNVFRKFVALLLASLFALSCVSVVAAAEISEAVKGVSPGYLSSSSGLAGNATGITISMPSGSANYGYLFEDNPSGVYDYSFVIEMPTSTDGVFAGKEPGSDVFSDIYGLHFGIPGALEVTLNPRSVVEGYFGVKVEGSSYTPNYTTYIDVEGIGKSFAPASGATFEVSGEIDLGGKTVSIYFDGMLYAQNLPIPKDGPIDMFTFFTPDSLEYDIVVQDFQVSRIGDSQDSNVPEAVKGVSPGYLGSSSGLSGSASDVTISMPSGSANYGYLFEDNPSGVYDYSFVIEMPTNTEGVFAGKEPGSDVFSDIYGLHFGIPGALEVTLNPRSAVEGFFGVKVEGSSYTPNYTTYIDVEGIGKSFAPAQGATFEVSGEIDLGGKTVSIYFDGTLYAKNLPIPKDGSIEVFTFFTPDSLEYDIVVQDFQVSRIGDSQVSNVPEAVKGVSPGYLGSSLGLAGSASDVTISMPSGSANYGYLFEDNPSGVYDYSFVIEMPTSTEGVFAGKEPGSDAFSDIYGLHFGIPGALEVTLNPRSAVEGFFGVKVEGSSYTPNYTTYIDVEGIGKSFAPALGATFEVSGEIDLGGKTVSIYFDDVLYAQNLPIPKDGPIDAFTFFTPDTLNYYITIQDFQISKIESNPSALGSWSLNEQLKGLASGSVLGNLALGDFGAWNGSFVEMLEETGEKIAKIEYGAGAGFGIKLFESGKGAGTFVAEFDIMEESALSSAEATAMGGAWLDLGFYNGQPADGNFPFKVLINYSNQGDGQANRQGPQFCPEFRDLAPQVFMNDHEWYHVIITRDYVSGIDIVDVYDPIMARIGHFERLFADGGKSDEVEGFAIFSVNATNAFYIKNAEIAYSEPPDAPTLLSPVDLAPSAALRTYFKWSPSDAMEYRLQISEDQDFSKLKLDKPLGLSLECELSESEALSPRTNYWWRVVAVKADGEHASDAWSFMTDFAVPEDGVYEAGLYGLIPGDWDGWDQEYKDLYGANYYIDIPMRNAEIIQSLLDKAVARAEVTESNPEGYTTVLLPPGIYCVGADVMKRSQSALRIKYDYTVLKGSGDPEGVGSASLENGGTVIKTPFQYMQGPGVGDYRVTAVAIDGGEFGSSDARDHVRIENFELDGGSHWTGDYNWDSSYGGAGYNGYDFGWDVTSHGIVINVDRLVDHVYINHMYVHSYRGEMMYIGGHATGYLEVSFSKVGDTNASTNNLDGNAYYDHDNQWGLEDYNSRFWMEFSPRQCSPGDSYEWLPLPDYAPQEMKDAFEEGKSISYFTRNRYLNADYTKASTIAIAQAMNDSTYMHFVDNTFDNSGVEENYKKSPYYSMDEEEFTRLKELSNDGLTYSDANTKNSIFQMAGGAFGDGGGLFIKENKVIEHHGAFFDYNNGGPTGENIWFVRSGNITVEGNEGTIGASGAPIFGFTGSWPPYLMHTDHVSIKGNKFTAAESGVISVLVSGPNDYGIGESFTIGWWGDFVAGQPINESNVNNDSLHPLSVNPYVPYDNGPELVYGMSAYLGDSIEISGNEFTNAQAPKSYFKFWGLMPLFKDNSYIGANSAPVETSAQSPEIKSVCEEILVKALDAHEAELFASDEAGRSYRDGQPLLITLDSGSAELAFVQTGAGYVADRAFALKAGESAKFVFDSEKGLWVNTEAPEKVPDKDPEKAPDVKASPVSGAYSSPLLVELESDAGEIWYTTDGSDPRTSDKREKYASAITIALPATIKAYASQADMIDGEISEFNYTLIETPAPVFSLSPSELSPSSVVYGYVPEENTFELSFAGSQTIEDLVFYFEGEAFDASDADVVAGSGADGSLDAFKEGDKAHIRVAPKAGLDTGLYTGRLIYESQGAKTALDISFLVAPADISGLSIQPIQPARRTGSPIEPEVLISGLELGVDFTVSYLDNVNVGTATVIATGIGNYTGTIEAFFDIVAETATDYFPSYYAPYYAQAPSPTPVPKVSAIPGFYATSADVVTNLALELYKAKLFVGIGLDASGKPVFELERPLTRLEAIVIVLRLLGLEKAANESLYKNPFSDVPAWGDRAAAYAFRAGITVGVDEEHTLLASDRLVTAQEFTAFLLRALGYSEASGDFDYQNALGKSVKVGMFAQSELDAFAKDASFLRAEAVISMVDALRTSVKGGGTLLIDKLADQVGKAVAESLVKNSSALYRPGR